MKLKFAAGTLAGIAAAATLLTACSYAANDKAVFTEYYDHIEYLNRAPDVADSGSRYRIAKEFFDEVDFEGIKDKALLLKLIGKPTKVTGAGDSQTLEYRYDSPADGPTITATFKCEGAKVVSAKVTGI